MSDTKDFRITKDDIADAVGDTIQPYSADATLKGNTFNGAGQLIELDSDGKIPSLDGSAISEVDAVTTNGLTVETSVPEDAVFTDTQVENTSELTNDSSFLADVDGFSLDLGEL